MQALNQRKRNQQLMQKLTTVLIAVLITTTVTSVAVFVFANSNRNNHINNTYDSTLWSSLQLQMQTYRFLDFLRTIEKNPENAIEIYSHYGLLMSRVDLLRMGPISNQIHYISDGRSIRLLNIIHGEFELLNDVVLDIENNDFSQVNATIEKMQQLDKHVNRLINLINQGTQEFTVKNRQNVLMQLSWLKYSMIIFMLNSLILGAVLFRNIKVINSSLRLVETTQEKIKALLLRKKYFLNTMGHEVRTPLDRCLSMISLLKTTNLNQEQAQILQTTEDASKSLLGLITDFLDLSKIESNNLELSYKPINLLNEIGSVLSLVNEKSNHKNVRLLNYIDFNLPNQVIIDADRIKQIIFNLVDNSFKFTHEGHISVITRLSQAKPTGWRPDNYQDTAVTMIQISIKDTGIGVPDKITELLRMPIHDENMSIPESRSCLSLSLCRFLTHMMKGSIVCHSPTSGGSEFIIELPVFHQKNQSIRLSQEVRPSLMQLADKNMIIIEKNPSVAHLLSMQANALGIQTPIYSHVLHTFLEKKIDFIFIADDSALDDISYVNIKKLMNSGSTIIASKVFSQTKSKNMAKHMYNDSRSHLNMLDIFQKTVL